MVIRFGQGFQTNEKSSEQRGGHWINLEIKLILILSCIYGIKSLH